MTAAELAYIADGIRVFGLALGVGLAFIAGVLVTA